MGGEIVPPGSSGCNLSPQSLFSLLLGGQSPAVGMLLQFFHHQSIIRLNGWIAALDLYEVRDGVQIELRPRSGDFGC